VTCELADGTNSLMFLVCHPPTNPEKTYFNVIDVMIKKGLEVNAKNVYGETALHFAARYRNVSAINRLILNGASINTVTELTDSTPIHYALRRTAFQMLTTLELVMIVEIFDSIESPKVMGMKDVSGVTPEMIRLELGISLETSSWSKLYTKPKVCILIDF
jgi:ankyrin repeat protein